MSGGAPLTLVIDTDDGVVVRKISAATPLPPGKRGDSAEDATRSAAATWGMPDFVFRPVKQARGAAQREIGDALLIVDRLGVVVQVKSRDTVSDNDEREKSWLTKNVDKGIRQGLGTIRALSGPVATSLTNERGDSVEVRGREIEWAPVVVVDHDRVPEYVPPGDVVVLLRRDWEFLFEQLKSTDAVVRYLHRVRGLDAVALGQESVRYYDLAAADAAAPPGPINEAWRKFKGNHTSQPLLPREPAGHDGRADHLFVRALLEDIATVSLPPQVRREAVLDVLAALDTLPVAYRAALGRDMRAWFSEMRSVRDGSVRWRYRNIWPPLEGPVLVFAVTNASAEDAQKFFPLYVSLRHQQVLEAGAITDSTLTVGIVITARFDGARPWDTTMVATSGDQDLEPEWRQQLEEVWGPTPGDVPLGSRIERDPPGEG